MMEETDSRQALSVMEDMSRRTLKGWSSSLEERLFWVTGVNRSVSELTASDDGTEQLTR